jgi:hypothetical protein
MKTKMLALFAVVVLAVALAGTAYAQWSSTVTVNGTINFGTLKLQWNDVSSTDPRVSAEWANDAHTAVTVTINNAYPGLVTDINFQTINTGSLPLKYDTFQITNDVDNRVDQKIILSFLAPNGVPNVSGYLNYFETARTYTGDFGIAAQYVTLQPGDVQDNKIRITIGNDIPAEFQGYPVTMTFALTAAPA